MELANQINELANNSTPIDFYPARDWDHSGKRYGSTEKASKELGFKAQVDIKDGLDKTIKWTRENLSLIESCMKKHSAHLPDDLKAALA